MSNVYEYFQEFVVNVNENEEILVRRKQDAILSILYNLNIDMLKIFGCKKLKWKWESELIGSYLSGKSGKSGESRNLIKWKLKLEVINLKPTL